MLKLKLIVSLIVSSLIVSSCASTGGEVSKSKTLTPLLVKNSGLYSLGTTHRAKLGDYIIKEPVEPQDMVKVNQAFSFKGRNPLVGILGPEKEYNVDRGDKFYKVRTKRSPETYCRLKGEKLFKICLIDENKDGVFDYHALSVMQEAFGPGDLFQEKPLSKDVSYTKADKVTGLYYAIRYRRGFTKPSFFQYMIDEDNEIIAELYGVEKPPKAAEVPYNIQFRGSEIQVTKWDNWELEYKIIKPVSPTLSLTRM